jgi:hypothetical protein
MDKIWTYDETIEFWKDLISKPQYDGTVDRLKVRCRYCNRLLQHGHCYQYSGEWFHRDCYLTILDFINASPDIVQKNKERFIIDNGLSSI